jgi:hypothetical protein
MWSSSSVKIIGRETAVFFENKTRSTTHNKRELNPPTQTRMRIEGTSRHNTQQEGIQPTNSNTHAHRGDFAAQHTTEGNTTHQLKHTCALRELIVY